MEKQSKEELLRISTKISEILSDVEDKRNLIGILIIQFAHVLMKYYKKSGHGEILIHAMNDVINQIDEAEEEIRNEEGETLSEIKEEGNA